LQLNFFQFFSFLLVVKVPQLSTIKATDPYNPKYQSQGQHSGNQANIKTILPPITKATQSLLESVLPQHLQQSSPQPQHHHPLSPVKVQKAESPEKIMAPLLIDPKDELPIKGEPQLDSQLQNESMSMLLCDETIPSSPAPNHQSIIPNVKRVYHNAAFLQPQNVTVAAAISFSSGNGGGSDGGGGGGHNKPSSSTEAMYTTIEKSRGGSVTAAATSTTGTAGKTTSDSSPRDSLSQDDSKSDSEDLKKTGKWPGSDDKFGIFH
jgi:hypothetical protein